MSWIYRDELKFLPANMVISWDFCSPRLGIGREQLAGERQQDCGHGQKAGSY
jgi:hypothetical protein